MPPKCSAGASATSRSPRSRPRCPTSVTRRSRSGSSSGSPRRNAPGRHRGHPERGAHLASAITATFGFHTELLSDGVVDLVEQGVVTGTRKSLRPNKVVTTFARPHSALRRAAREPCGREASRRLRQLPAHRRAQARLRLDQRHDGGRPVRPVRVGEDGRALLVLERRADRLRARGDVLKRRTGVHRAALDHGHRDQPNTRAPHRGSASTRLRPTAPGRDAGSPPPCSRHIAERQPRRASRCSSRSRSPATTG
jgi:hypothetical protein